jgi:hypothetical protein
MNLIQHCRCDRRLFLRSPSCLLPAAGRSPSARSNNERQIIEALAEFNAGVRAFVNRIVGPAFIRFFVQPERGVSTAMR